MISVEDWAEIRRLRKVQKLSKRAIARRLGIHRDTVTRALESDELPRYQRVPRGSKLDPYKPKIHALLADDPKLSGVRLLELRYSPSYITEGHQLTFEDAYDAIDRGISKAKAKYDMGITLICIVSRAAGEEAGHEVLRHINKHRGRISAIDLAEKESGFDFESCREIFAQAKQSGLSVTVHAGEERGLARNVQAAVEVLQADRIGHGIQIINDQSVLQLVKERNLPLEVCPTSNMITRNVDSLAAHPLAELHRAGVKVTVNSDDPGMIGVDLTHEYLVCHEQMGVSIADLQQMTRTALESSFLNADEKSYYERSYFTE